MTSSDFISTQPFGPDARRRTWLWLLLLAGGGCAWGLGWMWDGAPRLWRAVLVSFMFFTPLTAALATWPAIVQLSRGKWAGRMEPAALSGLGFAIPSLLLLGLLWITAGAWAPWAGRETDKGVYLSRGFLFSRDLGALAIFWLLAYVYAVRRNRGLGGASGAWLIVVYSFVFSLLGVDLLMALDYRWYSTMAPGYVFISGFYGGVVAWAFMTAYRSDANRMRMHDMGKLVMAFSILTGYLAYANLFPIWYENIPQETRFFIPRMNYAPWKYVSWIMLGQYLGPLVLLLTVWAKRSRWFSILVLSLMLAILWLDRLWLVAPTFDRDRLLLGLPELGALAALLGLTGLCMEAFGRRFRARVREVEAYE